MTTTPLPRRGLLRTAAWAAPTAIAMTAAPALAVSKTELEGLLRVNYRSAGRSADVEVTTRGTGLGLHVDGPRPSSARLTLFLSRGIVPATTRWHTVDAWTRPAHVRTEGGFTVWESTHQGTWTPNGTTWNAQPFTWTTPAVPGSPVQARVIRTVVIDGVTVSTDSGVVTLGQARARTTAAATGEGAEL
ncbi:hypothetical protein ACXET9_07180 [Brachybacterium sp. DNPG3]